MLDGARQRRARERRTGTTLPRVEPPSGQRRPRPLSENAAIGRGLLIGVMWLLVAPLYAVILLIFDSDIGGYDGHWVGLRFYLAFVVVTWLLARRLHRRFWILGLAVAAWLGLSFGLPVWAAPNSERFVTESRVVPAPPGATLVHSRDDIAHECVSPCRERWRYYDVADPAAASRWMDDWATRSGWEPKVIDHGATHGWCKDWYSLMSRPGTAAEWSELRDPPARGPGGLVVVRVAMHCH